MSKSVLVIDTPECCDGCEMCDRIPGPWCRATGNVIAGDPESGRAAGCPLKPMPEKRSDAFVYTNVDGYKTVRENSYASGWNECINKILGGNNE